MVVKYNSEQLHMMELLKCDWGKRIFYANPDFNNFAYFFYKFNIFRVGTLHKINIHVGMKAFRYCERYIYRYLRFSPSVYNSTESLSLPYSTFGIHPCACCLNSSSCPKPRSVLIYLIASNIFVIVLSRLGRVL